MRLSPPLIGPGWPADITQVIVDFARKGIFPMRRPLENTIGPIPRMPEFIAYELSRTTPFGYSTWADEWCQPKESL